MVTKSRTYSDLLPADIHERLLISPQLRNERQQEKRAALPIVLGRAMLGAKRPEEVLDLVGYRTIPKDSIVTLGKRLQGKAILIDKTISRHRKPPQDPDWYRFYVNKARKANQRPTPNPQELSAKVQAKERQSPYSADGLHRHVWVQLQLARLFGASLQSTRASRIHTTPLDETAAFYSASAIEDFGFCLEGHEATRRVPAGARLPKDLRQIGIQGAHEPERLMAQHETLFLLVQREQERRQAHWGNLLEMYEELGGSRKDQQDIADEAMVDHYVAETLGALDQIRSA